MTWARATTIDGLPIIERYSGGGHIVAIKGREGLYSFDAWVPGTCPLTGYHHTRLGNYPDAQSAREAVEGVSDGS